MNLRWKLHFALLLVPVIGLVCASPLVIPGLAQQEKNKAKKYSQEKEYARPTDPSFYVGSETCKTCYEDMPTSGCYKTFERSTHVVTTLDEKKGPEWHGCEACYGPGKKHVDGGGDKTKIFSSGTLRQRKRANRCLGCREVAAVPYDC